MNTIIRLPAVETASLLLREIEPRDAGAFCDYMMQDSYQRHIAMRLRTEAEVKAFVSRTIARQGDDRRNLFHLAAEDKASGEAIGDGFLIMQQPNAVEIGWGLHPALWRKGLGTEIGQALTGLAFERLKTKTVWCKVMGANAASTRLARRIGLRRLKSHADHPIGQGQTGLVEYFSMSADDYFDQTY